MKKKSERKTPFNAAGQILFGTARAPLPITFNENSVLQQALSLHQQSKFDAAESLYIELIRRNENNVVARNFLGLLKYQTGDTSSALLHLEHALHCDSGFAPAWNNQGLVFRKLGRYDESIQSYQRALAIRADYFEACLNLVNVLRDANKFEDAELQVDKCLQIRPNAPLALNAKGAVLIEMGQPALALPYLEKAIDIAPALASAHQNKGNACVAVGKMPEAIKSYETALTLDPSNVSTLNSLACIQLDWRQFDAAIANFNKAIKLDPNFFPSRMNLGNAYDELGQFERALPHFHAAVQIAIDDQREEALLALGVCYVGLQRYSEAELNFEAVLKLRPKMPLVKGYLWDVYRRTIAWSAADRLAENINQDVVNGELAIQPFSYLTLTSDASLQKKCAVSYFNHQHGNALLPLARNRTEYSEERIRVAYVSPDFREHAVAKLMVGVLEAHDPVRFDVYVVSLASAKNDPIQQRIQRRFEKGGRFFDASMRTDDQVVQWMRNQRIDIAVDLSGYTLGSRPGIFARRSAPVQVNMLGYAGTLGSSAWDYILGDGYITPKEHDEFYAEKVVRLPKFFAPVLSNGVGSGTLTRQEVGLPPDGFVYCCFNNIYKISQVTFAVWMGVLHAVPKSVLWLRCDDKGIMRQLQEMATSLGIDGTRLMFAPKVSEAMHLARMEKADLFLDTWPYNAHSTAIDALSSNLPVLTYSGTSFASRVAGSLMTHAGVPELVVSSVQGYEKRAIELALDPHKITQLREKIRASISLKEVYSIEKYCGDLEAAFDRMAKASRSGLDPESFGVGVP